MGDTVKEWRCTNGLDRHTLVLSDSSVAEMIAQPTCPSDGTRMLPFRVLFVEDDAGNRHYTSDREV
jgi:hypothetical protein